MNFPRDTEMASATAMRSNLSDLQTLLMNSGQQQRALNEGGENNMMLGRTPWPSNDDTPMMRWDQSIPNQDINRLPFPSFSNLNYKIGTDGSNMPKRFNNLPAVFAESSPSKFGGGGIMMSAKSLLGNASLPSRMNMKSSSYSNLKSNNKKKAIKKSSSLGGLSSLGGFPMPRLGGALKKKSTRNGNNGNPKFLSLAISVARDDGKQQSKSNNFIMNDNERILFKTMRHGCFPLPKLSTSDSIIANKIPYSLEWYRDLWVDSHDGEVSREIFARRLQRCCTITEERTM